ncbi:glycosyltransferase [Candidatus Pelagibacter sp.]|uniref:glycosyltransferase n=1 Tax=Candidatus Pelagibacter sp. TaxID=2024849 RepID=UPI003F840ADF
MSISNKSNKIYFFLPSFQKGGVSKISINLINFFVKKKKKILLFTLDKNIKKLKHSKYLEIFTVKKKNKNFLSSVMSNYFLALKISKKLKPNDVVLSMQNHFFLLLFNFLRKNKIIIRNSEEIFGATKYADNKFNGIIVFCLKVIFYQFAYKIIAISSSSKNSLEKILINKKKIKLIYNPYLIKINKFVPKKKNKKKFFILSTGRLVKQKNFELLIDAVINIKKKRNISLLIIGEGNRENILKDKIKNLNFIKIIKWNENLAKYYKKANLFVMSSYYEGLPNVLLESINNNTPILASNCSGVSDIIGNDKGYTFKIGDKNDLQKKIIYIMDNYLNSVNRSKIAHKNLNKFTNLNCNDYLNLINDEKKI